ncbi:MAG: hypothetical protein HN685_00800, partial [Waddliaceae bacterium]|nr:hypothetical protein [Waddliaceae bacterium]
GGSPNPLEQWVNGKQEGITTLFNNGGIFSKTPYISNTKHGVEHRYQDGNVVEAITWDKGLRHGPTYHYIADTVSTDWYYQNKLVSKLYYEEQLINF